MADPGAMACLKAEVESRLNQTHESRISQLASRLHASMQSPWERTGPSVISTIKPASSTSAGRLGEVFDELLASDQTRRVQQLNEEVTFRERELFRLREALDKAQLDASLSKQKQDTMQAQLDKASQASSLFEVQLRALQRDHEQLGQDLQAAAAGRAAAERAAALSDTRAATAEALLATRTQELGQMQAHYKRLLAEQQAGLDRLRDQAQAQAAELSRDKSAAATREQDLLRELQAANSSLVDLQTALAAAKGCCEVQEGKVAQLAAELQAADRAKQQLQGSVQELEQLLAESDSERRAVRAKYMNLGDKLEALLADEAAQQRTAAAELDAAQQQLHEAQSEAATAKQQASSTVAQLSEAQEALIEADRLHRRAVRKLERQLAESAADHDACKQELLLRSAELLDMQSQLQEAAGQHQAQIAAAQQQASLLQGQIAQLQQKLQEAVQHEQQVRQEVAASAEDRLEIELRQQQLKYERQIQELELHNRYITALDLLSSSSQTAATRRALDQAAAAAAGGGDGGGSFGSGGADIAVLGGCGRLDAFDARLRRTLAEHAGREQALEAMESRLLSAKKELSADYQRRLDSLEAEWAARSQARLSELEAAHALKLQQVELTGRLERERADSRLAEAAAAKQRLEDQLAAAQQDVTRLTREASQLRLAGEEARVARQLLQGQLDEAHGSLRQLQAVVAEYTGGAKGDRGMISDLMMRLEQRTVERNEAMQAAAAAEGRLKVLESEKIPGQQRQLQQAVDAAEAGRAAAEAKLKHALAEAAEAASAAEAAQSSAARQVKRLTEERAKLADSLEEVSAARTSLDQQLSLAQADVRSLSGQLRDCKTRLSLLQEDHAALETVMARLKEERQQLMTANMELESVHSQLSSQVALTAEDQRRLSLVVQGLEISKAGLARRLSVVEAEKQVVMRTNELRAASPSLLGSLGPSSPPAAAGGGGSPGGSPAAAGSVYERAASPSLGASSAAGFGSFAGFRGSRRTTEVFDGLQTSPGGSPPASSCMQDLDGLLCQFDAERRAMAGRYEALESENSTLRQQLAAATLRASELSISNEQLLSSLERHKGVLMQESKAASELTDKVLSDVQRSSNDLAQLNNWLQGELEAARKGHKAALAAASAAEQKSLVLEAKVSELQRSSAAALRDAEAAHTSRLAKLEKENSSQLSSLRAKAAQAKEEARQQLEQAASEHERRLAELQERHAKELAEQQAAAAAAAEAATVAHDNAVAQLKQLLEEQTAAARSQIESLHQQLQGLQQRCGDVTHQLRLLLQLPQQHAQQPPQQQQGWSPGFAGSPGQHHPHMQQQQLQQQQQQQHRSSFGPGFVSSPSDGFGFQQQQHQLQLQNGHAGNGGSPAAAAATLPQEVLDMSAGLSATLAANASMEDAAGALRVLFMGLCQHCADALQQLLELEQENQQLLQDGAALAGDFQTCATNLQSLVATLAFSIPVEDEVQQGLNAKDPAVFDAQLAALHEAIVGHIEAEKAAVGDALKSGPMAELQQQLDAAQARLAEATGTIKQMKTERQEELARFEEGLHRARVDAADGAEVARKESLAGLRAELQAVKSQLTALQEAHSAELAAQQDAAAKQLAAHVKTADAVVKELEATAVSLQGQLAAEVEYGKELRRLQADKERQLQLEARKERRQTGEIEGLRERLRNMEREKEEKEGEVKQLKRNLRQKELSLLTANSAANSLVEK